MAQLFPPRANPLSRIVLGGGLILLVLLAVAGDSLVQSPYYTGVGVAPPQPVPFSHQHHVASLGIDCRYCHASVERSAFAGLPATDTCMTCHSQLWTDAAMLEPVRRSLRDGVPLRWRRVYDLPDFVYFDHSVHVRNGVGCSTCHGRVDRMPLTYAVRPFFMEECLACHRDPGRHLRPPDQVFAMDWQPAADQAQAGRRLLDAYAIQTAMLDDCSICHR